MSHSPTTGTLYLTISLMVEVERLEKHYGQAGFNVQHLKNQIRHYHDSHAIAQAMNPMFDDIADRKRDIYVQDFLIDTPSQIHIPTEEEPNLDETIALHFNPRLNWRTEGKPFSALLNDTGDKVELMAQPCKSWSFPRRERTICSTKPTCLARRSRIKPSPSGNGFNASLTAMRKTC
jgi:hypothetical protein